MKKTLRLLRMGAFLLASMTFQSSKGHVQTDAYRGRKLDTEITKKSGNNSAALAQDPASASRDTRNSILWALYATKVLAVQLSSALVTPWTGAHQAPMSMGFFRQRILEWIAIPFSKGSFQPRDWMHVSYVSCVGRWILYHLSHQGSPCPQ